MFNNTIESVYSAPAIGVSSQARVKDAIDKMSKHNISCLVVLADSRPVGIVTERTIVMSTAKYRDLLLEKDVTSIMSSPVYTINPVNYVYEAYSKLFRYKVRHLVVVDTMQNALGVLSQSDVVKLVNEKDSSVNIVASIMSKSVVTVHNDASLASVVDIMALQSISCVIVEDRGFPVGVISERDVTNALTKLDHFHSTKAAEIMSSPVHTVKSNVSLNYLASLFEAERIRRAVVVNTSGSIVGVVTHSDITKNLYREYVETLERIITEKEIEFQKQNEILCRTNEMLEQASILAKVGGWEKNFVTGDDYWTSMTKMIHEVAPDYVPNMHDAIQFYKEGESRRTITEVVDKCIKTGEPYDVEVELVTAKGNLRWVRTIGFAAFDGKKCIKLYGSIQDITIKKRIEFTLEEIEFKYKTIFNTISDPIFVLSPDYSILQVNEASEQLFGVSAQEIIGRKCFCLVHATNEPIADCPHSRVLNDGDEHCREVFSATFNKHFHVKVIPAKSTEGSILYSVHIARDITEIKTKEREFRKLSNEYFQVFEGTQDALFLVEVVKEKDFRFIRTNLSHQRATGIPLEAIRGKSPHEVLGQELGQVISDNYSRCVEAEKPISYEEKLQLPVGEKIWYTTLTPVFENGKCMFIVGSGQDITARKIAEEKLKYLATTDELTGLYNRRHFLHLFDYEIRRATRYKHKLALCILDIDHFKNVNDTFGHAAGDAVLQHLSFTLREQLRDSDILGRLGGEEFAVLLPEADYEVVKPTAERLRCAIAESHTKYSGFEIKHTVSIGVSFYSVCYSDVASMLKAADNALYTAKDHGRNTVYFDEGCI